jgi:flagellar biosynthesis/type III secretory pathway M-ring protein FliF/YscJ
VAAEGGSRRLTTSAAYPDPVDGFWGVVWALGPTVCVGLLFWFVMRAILRADRTEREAQARVEAEELDRDLDRFAGPRG